MDTLNSTALMKLENRSFDGSTWEVFPFFYTPFAVFASPIVVFFNYSNTIKGLLELAASVLGKFNFSIPSLFQNRTFHKYALSSTFLQYFC